MSTILNKLLEYRNFEDNWNDYNAKKPIPASLDACELFIKRYVSDAVAKKLETQIDASGHVGLFVQALDKDLYLDQTVFPDGTYECYIELNNEYQIIRGHVNKPLHKQLILFFKELES